MLLKFFNNLIELVFNYKNEIKKLDTPKIAVIMPPTSSAYWFALVCASVRDALHTVKNG